MSWNKGLSSNHLHLCWWVWAIFPCLYVVTFLVVFHSDDGSLLKHVSFLPRIKKKKLSSLWLRVICKMCVDRKNTVVSKAGLKADQCGHPHRLRQAQNRSAESAFFREDVAVEISPPNESLRVEKLLCLLEIYYLSKEENSVSHNRPLSIDLTMDHHCSALDDLKPRSGSMWLASSVLLELKTR